MTYANMRNLVWAGLGTDSSTETDLVGAATINRWFDAWEYEIIKKVMMLPRDKWQNHLDALVTTVTRTGDGSTVTWTLPSDMIEGGDLAVTVGGQFATRREISYLRTADTNSLYASTAEHPDYYILRNKLGFPVAPTNGYTIYLYYISQPAGTDGTTSELDPKFHQTGVWYALAQAFAIDGDNEQVSMMNDKFEKESEALIR